MFILIKTHINDDYDTYELLGTYNTLDDARKAMWEASDDSLNSDYDYDTRELNRDETVCVVFAEDYPRSYCDRFVIFDSDNPVTYEL